MLHSQPKEDTYVHKGMRRQLVQEVREKGISDPEVLGAIERIPRHFFLDSSFERQAYEDRAFPIAAGQTISQPYTVAFMTELLQVSKYQKVLEIGTGSAYQAVVLAEMGAQVFSIERQKELFDFVGKFFFLKKYTGLKRFYGDGFAGLTGFAPFDRIIVTCGAPFIPPALVTQLKAGGRMVIPVGEQGSQRMVLLYKDAAGNIFEEDHGLFAFVPMLQGKNNK